MDFESADELRPRPRVCFEPKARFPVKLYEVANDGFLVKWSSSGTSVFVEEDFFEEKVMKCYPGFVQIASFPNIRRLFREYSFDWRIVEGTETVFEFSHPDFIRDRKELLHGIKTKRKSFLKYCNQRRSVRPLATSSPKKRGSRRRYRRRRDTSETDSCPDNFSVISGSFSRADTSFTLSATRSISDFSQTPSNCEFRSKKSVDASNLLYSSTHVLSAIEGRSGCWNSLDSDAGRPTQHDLLSVLAVYAQNELKEEEYLQLLANTAASEQSVHSQVAPTDADDVREITTLQSLSAHSPQEAMHYDVTGIEQLDGWYKNSQLDYLYGDEINQPDSRYTEKNDEETASYTPDSGGALCGMNADYNLRHENAVLDADVFQSCPVGEGGWKDMVPYELRSAAFMQADTICAPPACDCGQDKLLQGLRCSEGEGGDAVYGLSAVSCDADRSDKRLVTCSDAVAVELQPPTYSDLTATGVFVDEFPDYGCGIPM